MADFLELLLGSLILPLLIVTVDFPEHCSKDKEQAHQLFLIYHMMEPQDIDNDSEALPKCDHEGRDVLAELLDHPVYEQLAHCIEDRKFRHVPCEVLVVQQEVQHCYGTSGHQGKG